MRVVGGRGTELAMVCGVQRSATVPSVIMCYATKSHRGTNIIDCVFALSAVLSDVVLRYDVLCVAAWQDVYKTDISLCYEELPDTELVIEVRSTASKSHSGQRGGRGRKKEGSCLSVWRFVSLAAHH